MTPFRPLLKDYFLVCETYYSAIRSASPRQIESIDRERRTLHNEGAELMSQRLAGRSDRPGHGPAPVRARFRAALEGVTPAGALWLAAETMWAELLPLQRPGSGWVSGRSCDTIAEP